MKEETVGHHSHGVALLISIMFPESHYNIIYAALLHDLAEQVTGDIPSPQSRKLKEDPSFKSKYEKIEDEILEKNSLPLPKLNETEKLTLKFADIMHGALTCIQEMRLGNNTQQIKHVYNTYIDYAYDLIGLCMNRSIPDYTVGRFRSTLQSVIDIESEI